MKYKLSELFERPISGEWGKELEEGKCGSKVIRTTNFTNIGRLNLNDVVERDIDIEKYEGKLLKIGDIIIEKSGGSPNQPVGRVVIFEENTSEKYFCNNFTSILRPKNIITSKYALYLLKDLYNKRKVLKYQNKTTGIINLKLNDYLNNTEINIPSIEEQIKISTILGKSQELIDKRKEQIEVLDELVKSQFIEMFGDPIINSKGLQIKNFEEVVRLQRGFDLPTYERDINGNINVWGSNGVLSKHSTAKVDEPGVITGRSGSIGNVYYTLEPYWPLNTTLFSKNTFGNNVIYLSYLLKFYKLERFSNGTGVPTLNRNLLDGQKIINVPLEEQNCFADFVKQTDKLKFEMEKSLKELEDNFNSLIQKAFNGELVN